MPGPTVDAVEVGADDDHLIGILDLLALAGRWQVRDDVLGLAVQVDLGRGGDVGGDGARLGLVDQSD